jgi:hypothetical protein
MNKPLEAALGWAVVTRCMVTSVLTDWVVRVCPPCCRELTYFYNMGTTSRKNFRQVAQRRASPRSLSGSVSPLQ